MSDEAAVPVVEVMEPVRVSFVRTEEVYVLDVRTNTETLQTIIVLDRPWEELSEELRGRLFEEYGHLSEGHWREEGWSLAFVCETPTSPA